MNYVELIEEEIKKFKPVTTEERIDSGIVVGAGDSYAAALVIEGKTKRRALALDPLEAISLNVDKPFVIVSVSGRTKTNIELAKIKRKEGRKVIAITSNPSSPLAENSDVVITIPYKSEVTLPGTLSFLLSLSALYSLFGEEVPEKVSIKSFELRKNPFFVGHNENYGIAYYATLKLNEIFCEQANYERLELFPHSPIFSTRGRQIIILGNGDRERRIKELVDYTDVVVTGCDDPFCNSFAVIYSILERMKREGWNRICFLDDKQILNISSTIIYS